jgi:hypothetical protein
VRLVRVAIATALVFGSMASAPAGADTTTSTAPAPPAGVSLVSQTAWAPLQGTFNMVLHVDDPALAARPGAAISITVHASAGTRSAFDDAIDNNDLGGVEFQADPVPVSSLGHDTHGNVTMTFGLSGSTVTPTLGISEPGVYPVEVALTNTGAPAKSFVTWLVTVDTSSSPAIEHRLLVSWILPLVAPPMVMPDGSNDPFVTQQMTRGGRLDRVATVLARGAGIPLTLLVGPETVASWAGLAQHDLKYRDGFTRVRTAVKHSKSEILPNSYVPIDIPSLDSAGLGDLLPAQYVKGGVVTQSVLGTGEGPRAPTGFVDPANDAAIDLVRGMLVARFAVRDDQLVTVTHTRTPAQTFELATAGGVSRAAATAPFLESLLTGSDTPALKAARMLASLSEIAYESPGLMRGVVIAPPDDWTPDVGAMSAILAALHSNPLLEPATVNGLLTSVPPEQDGGIDVVRHLQNSPPPPMPVDPSRYTQVSGELDAYSAVVGADDPSVASSRQALANALSTSITSSRASAELDSIDNTVSSFTSAITTDVKRITLTARHAEVPLSFENHVKPRRTVQVMMHLASVKLTFPKGEDQLITLPPGSTTVRVAVAARATGTFPMTIRLTSVDGRLTYGAPVSITVRSAVFGGFAIALAIAALLFLAGWWINHFRRTRKSRRVSTPAALA